MGLGDDPATKVAAGVIRNIGVWNLGSSERDFGDPVNQPGRAAVPVAGEGHVGGIKEIHHLLVGIRRRAFRGIDSRRKVRELKLYHLDRIALVLGQDRRLKVCSSSG